MTWRTDWRIPHPDAANCDESVNLMRLGGRTINKCEIETSHGKIRPLFYEGKKAQLDELESAHIAHVNGIGFATNSATLSEQARRRLDESIPSIKKCLNEDPGRLVYIHAFASPPGGHELNDDLATRRARSVASYLVEKGVDRRRVQGISYGAMSEVGPDSAIHRQVTLEVANLKVPLQPANRAILVPDQFFPATKFGVHDNRPIWAKWSDARDDAGDRQRQVPSAKEIFGIFKDAFKGVPAWDFAKNSGKIIGQLGMVGDFEEWLRTCRSEDAQNRLWLIPPPKNFHELSKSSIFTMLIKGWAKEAGLPENAALEQYLTFWTAVGAHERGFNADEHISEVRKRIQASSLARPGAVQQESPEVPKHVLVGGLLPVIKGSLPKERKIGDNSNRYRPFMQEKDNRRTREHHEPVSSSNDIVPWRRYSGIQVDLPPRQVNILGAMGPDNTPLAPHLAPAIHAHARSLATENPQIRTDLLKEVADRFTKTHVGFSNTEPETSWDHPECRRPMGPQSRFGVPEVSNDPFRAQVFARMLNSPEGRHSLLNDAQHRLSSFDTHIQVPPLVAGPGFANFDPHLSIPGLPPLWRR